jgi:hypothetical protein
MQLFSKLLTIIGFTKNTSGAYSPPNPSYKSDLEWVKSIMLFYHFDYEKIETHLKQHRSSMATVRACTLEAAVKELKDIPNFGGRIALKCETPDFRIRVLGIRVPVVSKLRTLSK